MRVRCAIDGHPFSDVALVEDATIQQDSTQGISTCQVTIIRRFGDALYGHAQYDRATYASQVQEWQELQLYDEDSGERLFGGFILGIDRTLEGPHVKLTLDCSDYGIILDRTLITQTWPDGTPDSTIVSDLLAHLPGFTAGTIVTQVANCGEIEAKDQRIRDLLDDLCGLTGAEWNVGYGAQLNYYRAGSIVAPFALSDQPDGVTSQPYQLDDITRDFSGAANRITVLGALQSDTTELRATAQDLSSQQQFGILSATLVDRNLSDQTTATLWAQTELAARAWPRPTVQVSCYIPGLARGQTVAVEAARVGLSAALILRSLTIVVAAPDRGRAVRAGHILKYTASLGAREPDLVYTLRRLQRKPVERTVAPAATIAPGSITADDFAAGVEPVRIVNTLPALPDPDYSDTAVVLLTSDRKIYRRTGNTWTAYVPTSDIIGQIQTNQLAPGSVTSTVLADGSVVSAKIPAGAIKGPQIEPGAVNSVQLADGAVVTSKIPVGAVQGPNLAAGSVTANAISAGAVSAAAIAAGAITANAIAAGAITATALAAGSVTANAIAANAVYAQALQANAVTAQAIAANAITAGKIAALAVIAGNLAADAVTAGTIAAGAVSATALAAGAVTAGKISAGAIRAQDAVFVTGAIQDADIGTLNGGKIIAGTIDASKLNALEIAVGYGGNKPGRVGVYDGGQGLVALLGDMGGAGTSGYGIWARMFGAGGSGYNDSKLKTDLAGNLFLTNAFFQITAGSNQLYTSPTTFDTSYSTLALKNEGGSDRAEFISRGMVIYYGGSKRGHFVRDPGGGYCTFELSGGAGFIRLNESDAGRVRADGGFAVGSNVGLGTLSGGAKQLNLAKNPSGWVECYFLGGLLMSAIDH